MEIFKSESGIYHVSFLGKDGMTTRSTKERDLDRAKEVVKAARIREIEMAAKAGSLNAEALTAIMAGKKVRSHEAVAAWLDSMEQGKCAPNTISNYTSVVLQWCRELGAEEWPIAKLLTADNARPFINSGGRHNREYRAKALRRFSRFCHTSAYVVGDPVAQVEVNLRGMTHEQKEGGKREPVTSDEYKALIAAAEGFHRRAIIISYWTGLRLSDIACMEWASIDLDVTDSITLWQQKTQKRLRVPLSEPLIGAGELREILLELHLMATDETYCFPEARDIILDPKTRAKLSVQFGRLFAKVGIEDKTFHCLRHSFATRLKAAGKTIEQIGAYVGHASAETTQGYVHA